MIESPQYIAKKVLLGNILGDGSLSINNLKTKGTLHWNHSLQQLPYVIWKLHLLMPIIDMCGIRLRNVDKTGKYQKIQVWSKGLVYLKHIYDDFYFERNGKVKKEVHLNVLNRLDPTALAIWYQDDGGVNTRNGNTISSIALAVCSFSDSEIELICKYFLDVWYVKWTIKTLSSGYKVILTNSDSMRSFIEIIRPHVCRWMNYKINSLDSAKHLSIMEGDDMIRSFEQSKELNGNIQSSFEECVVDNNDLPLDEKYCSSLRVPYGIKLSDNEMQEYSSIVLSSKPEWRKLDSTHGVSWYLFLHGVSDNMIRLRNVFGGYIRNYGNNTEFRIGGKSAYRMCLCVELTGFPQEIVTKYQNDITISK